MKLHAQSDGNERRSLKSSSRRGTRLFVFAGLCKDFDK